MEKNENKRKGVGIVQLNKGLVFVIKFKSLKGGEFL